jgi:3-phenylpropionate/trans-cinnamate dioxygenase ferredoxin reductase subunit
MPAARPTFCAIVLPPAAAIVTPLPQCGAPVYWRGLRERGHMPDTIVVAGGGHAAAQVVDSLRRDGFEGRLVLACGEPALPYQRPPLSKKFLGGELDAERLPIRHAAYYEGIRCEVLLGNPVVGIDKWKRTVKLSDGGSLEYDKLVLAIGGHARPLPVRGANFPGVHVLRTMADVEAIRARARPGVRVAVVGAGYIGLECAATFRRMGLDVTVIEMMDRVMNRVVAPEMSGFYQAEHAAHGVNVLTERTVQGFLGNGSVHAVECTDGTQVPADLVIVGIGLVPNCALAEAAGLKCDDGIAVDEHCRTSDPHIYAIGDCCSHPSPRYGRRIRLESVDNAFEQAKSAAANLCGKATPHDKTPWFWSDQYELKLQIVGLSQNYDSVVLRGDPASRSFSCCYLKDGELIALDAVNHAKDFMAARKLIAERARPDPAKLADDSVGLKETIT